MLAWNNAKEIIEFKMAKFDRHELCAQATVLAISFIVVTVWVLTKPIVFTYDSFTYIDHARAFELGTSAADAFYERLPLFPLILWAFDVTDLKHSVFWLIIFQSVLAVSSCWLFYLMARLLEPRGAFVLTLVFIVSLLPFVQVKHVMTEQTFFFETMVALYGMLAYLMARTNREALSAVTILSVGAALMMLTRPQGSYVAPVLLGTIAVLIWGRAWAAFVGVVLIICIVWSVQTIDQRMRFGSYNLAGNFDNSHTTGAMLLNTFYLDGRIRISPKNGPRSTELKTLLLDELARSDALARRRGYLTSVPPADVPAFVEENFDQPNANFWSLLSFTALKERLGSKAADRLLVQVCLEAALAYPIETARMLIEKGVEAYVNPLMLAVPVHPQFDPGFFQPPVADEIAAVGDYTTPTSLDRAVDRNLRWLMRLAILLVLVTLPVALQSPTWRVTLALLVFGLYLNFAAVLGNTPLFRYVIYAIPANLLCGYIGVVALVSMLRNRYPRKSIV
jgi:hypothetical protein